MTISATTQGLRPGVCTSSNRPATPFEGQMIYETDTDLTYIYGGSAWQQVSGGTAVGNSGLVYITSATVGTGVTSVTVSNCFSATYDNYQIRLSGGTQSADDAIALKLGSSVTGYYGVLIYGAVGGVTANIATQNNAAICNWVGGGSAGQQSFVSVDLFDPFKSAYTKIRNGGYQNGLNYGTMQAEHRVATPYDVFTLSIGTGTLTGGTVTVYGYRKA
jgi:hypothetical protein